MTRTFVIGGTYAASKPYSAVGALVYKAPGESGDLFLCTGTLVAPRLALTAAHCVDGEPEDNLYFTPAARPARGGREVEIATVFVHPKYGRLGSSSVTHDIALLELGEELEGVDPEQLAADRFVEVGMDVELVGYGSTQLPQTSERRKNAGSSSVTEVSALELTVGAEEDSENCAGDSGGPSLALDGSGRRRVIGVVSRAADPDSPCDGGSIHTRVDAHRQFVDEVSAAVSKRVVLGASCAVRPARTSMRAFWGLPALLALTRRRRSRVTIPKQNVRDPPT